MTEFSSYSTLFRFGGHRYLIRRTNPNLDMSGHSISRRRFLGRTALGTAGMCTSVTSPGAWLTAQTPEPALLPSYVADANGNGLRGAQDEKVVRQAPAAYHV